MNKQVERLMACLVESLASQGLRLASLNEAGWYYFTGIPGGPRSVWVTEV